MVAKCIVLIYLSAGYAGVIWHKGKYNNLVQFISDNATK
jgi:hypothetical protein